MNCDFPAEAHSMDEIPEGIILYIQEGPEIVCQHLFTEDSR